jgi:hypothetical protein
MGSFMAGVSFSERRSLAGKRLGKRVNSGRLPGAVALMVI